MDYFYFKKLDVYNYSKDLVKYSRRIRKIVFKRKDSFSGYCLRLIDGGGMSDGNLL